MQSLFCSMQEIFMEIMLNFYSIVIKKLFLASKNQFIYYFGIANADSGCYNHAR